MPPAEGAPPDRASGARALLAVTRAGLSRLAALPESVFRPIAARLAASFPADSAEPSAMSTWPAEIRDLAIPLYERGLLVHCLPYYGSWLWDTLTADSDLAAVPTTRQFGRLAQQVLAEAGAPAAGVGAHSFRRGGAAELAHGGLSLPTLSAALRHVSERSTRPYVFQSVHSAANAGAMRAAARRSLAGGLAAPGASAATREAGGRARGLVAPQRGAAPSPRHLTNRGLCGRLVLDHDEPAFVGGVPALSPAPRATGAHLRPGALASDSFRSRSRSPIFCAPRAQRTSSAARQRCTICSAPAALPPWARTGTICFAWWRATAPLTRTRMP